MRSSGWSTSLRRLAWTLLALLALLPVGATPRGCPFPFGCSTPSVAAQDQKKEPLRDARTIVDEVPAGYELMAESAYLGFYMQPTTAQFAVRDRRSARVWLSDPAVPDLEGIPDYLQARLDSVFTVYLTGAEGTKSRQEDSVSKVSGIRIEPVANGVMVVYEMSALTVTIALRYELGPDYLGITVDDASLSEWPTNRLVGIDLWPHLGATPYGMESATYFVLPDGPGALAHVGALRPGYRKQFSATSYGTDSFSFTRPAESRVPLAAYGIAQPDLQTAVLAVVTGGGAESSIEARFANNPLSLSVITARHVYRRTAELERGGFGSSGFYTYFEKDRVKGDHAVRYFFLAGEEANWTGMAQRLRRHLIEDRGLPRLEGPAARPALRLRLVMGAEKPGLLGRRYVRVTDVDEAAEIVAACHDAGMENLDVVLVGWEKDGYEGYLPRHGPPDRRLGGARGLRRLVERVHALGGRLYLETDYVLALLRNGGFSPLTDAVIQPSLLPLSDLIDTRASQVPDEVRRGVFLLNPDFALRRYVPREIKRLNGYGVDGLELRWAGELVLKDANPRDPLERSEHAEVWQRILRMSSETLGMAASQGGNEYVLGFAETVTQFPLYRSNYVFAADTVPFYPMATHGLVRIYGTGSNLDSEPEKDFLRRLEYGMLPAYELTYRNPIVLARTTYPELHSSYYLDWVGAAAAEYDVMVDELGHTVNQFIVGHRQLAPQVHETRYEDGTRVTVNYGHEAFVSDGGVVQPLGYLVIRG